MKEFLDTIEKINDSIKTEKKNIKEPRKRKKVEDKIILKQVLNPIFVSVSEAAKLGGVTSKTIRRAIQSKKILYKIENDRYIIDFVSVVKFLTSNKKLANKFKELGLGQYIAKWRE